MKKINIHKNYIIFVLAVVLVSLVVGNVQEKKKNSELQDTLSGITILELDPSDFPPTPAEEELAAIVSECDGYTCRIDSPGLPPLPDFHDGVIRECGP